MSNFYYGEDANRYSFFRMPKALFTEERYKDLSTDAKVLYGIFLDRMGLSEKNHWLDEENRVYIIYAMDEIMADMNCGHGKVTKMVNELIQYDLIERRRQGQGKPCLIYVKDFLSDCRKSAVKSAENQQSGKPKMGSQDCRKSASNNTNINNTEFININPIVSTQKETYTSVEKMDLMDGMDKSDKQRLANQVNTDEQMEEMKVLEEYFRDEAGIDVLIQENPGNRKIIMGILSLLVETCSSQRKSIVIAGEERPMVFVKSRLMKLNLESLRYVLNCMEQNNSQIRNIRQYLLTALYNAPVTISAYYQAKVKSDMANFTERR